MAVLFIMELVSLQLKIVLSVIILLMVAEQYMELRLNGVFLQKILQPVMAVLLITVIVKIVISLKIKPMRMAVPYIKGMHQTAYLIKIKPAMVMEELYVKVLLHTAHSIIIKLMMMAVLYIKVMLHTVHLITMKSKVTAELSVKVMLNIVISLKMRLMMTVVPCL